MKNARRSKRTDWTKIILTAIVLAVIGYQWYVQNTPQPLADDNAQAPNAQAPNAQAPVEFLNSIGGKDLRSPAGLIYGMGGGDEHRIDHVMRHASDDSNRPSHGVFDGDRETILRLLDEAYEMVKQKSKYVKSESSQGNTAYTISMGRKVGYDGGEKGKRNGHRDLRSLRLILNGNRVITAYPVR